MKEGYFRRKREIDINKSAPDVLNTIESDTNRFGSAFFEEIDIDLLKKIIYNLENIDLIDVPLKEVQQVANILMNGFGITLFGLTPPKLYRARKNYNKEHSFLSTKELWYAPEGTTQMGRLNDIGKTIFYCSDDMNISFLECRPKIGDRLTIIECELIEPKPLRLLPIGMRKYYSQKGQQNLAHLPFEDNLADDTFSNPIDKIKNSLIHEFLVKEYTKIIAGIEKHKYKTTVSFTNNFLNNFNKIEGLVYPSVITNLKGVNLGLKPIIADEKLKITKCYQLDVLGLTDNSKQTFDCYMVETNNITENKIIWQS